MSTLTRPFLNFNFSIPELSLRRFIARWQARRIEAHNLARLSRRDLRDRGIHPASFDFHQNH